MKHLFFIIVFIYIFFAFQEQCLEESVQMISDCQIRLERAVADLEAQIV